MGEYFAPSQICGLLGCPLSRMHSGLCAPTTVADEPVRHPHPRTHAQLLCRALVPSDSRAATLARPAPGLLETGALCRLDGAFIEFHGFLANPALSMMAMRAFQRDFERNVSAPGSACSRTRILKLDDETYVRDGVPLP